MSSPRFIDLFSGIGGFHLGLAGMASCVYAADFDKHAVDMYNLNFGGNLCHLQDISKLEASQLPEYDILCAGFPCQAFSKAGKQLGFEDTRGTLFFDVCRLIEGTRPRVVLLENVRGLLSHDKGNTFKVILNSLKNLNYHVHYKLLNASQFGVPQNRERIILVCFREESDFNKFQFLPPTIPNRVIKDILLPNSNPVYVPESEYTLIPNCNQTPSGLIFSGYINANIRIPNGNKNLSRVHRQPNRIYHENGVHPTLSAGEQNGRYFIQTENKVRKLTLEECYLIMGFPTSFKKTGTTTQQYKRIGNSVCPPMIKNIMETITKVVDF